VYNDAAEIEEVPGNTRTSQEERPGSQSKSQKERSGSLVLGVFGAFAELLSDRRPLRCCSGPLRGLWKAHMGIFPAFLAFLPDSSLGFQVLPQTLNLSEKLITLRR
jgi:hypothetical protein